MRSVAVLVVAVTGLRVLVAVLFPASAQEAYYAEYAAHPALSYHDHPPMVAWSIAVGQALFGTTPLGLRFGSLAFGLGTALLGLATLREWRAIERARRLWVLAFVGVPLLAVLFSLALTDPPLVFFWTLAFHALWRARTGRLRFWILAGVGAGGALLSKYTAVFLVPGGLLVLALDPRMRRQLRSPGPWLAVLVAAVSFLPVVIWNARREWASFAFQTQGRAEGATLGLRWTAELLAGQIVGLGPFVAAALVASALWWARRIRRDERALWVLSFGLPLPLFLLAASLATHVKLNWLLPAYVPLGLGALVWASDALAQPAPGRAVRAARGLLVAMTVTFALVPSLRWLPWRWGNTWSGWSAVAARAEAAAAADAFLFSANHKDAALLSRALREKGVERTVLGANVLGGDGLAFEHWTRPRDYEERDAVCVVRDRPGKSHDDVVRRLRRRFATVEPADTVAVRSLGITVQRASLWTCRGYRAP